MGSDQGKEQGGVTSYSMQQEFAVAVYCATILIRTPYSPNPGSELGRSREQDTILWKVQSGLGPSIVVL